MGIMFSPCLVPGVSPPRTKEEQAIMKEGEGDGSSNWVEEGRDGESLEVEVMVG